jgi:Na+-transporting methylmalonyl-CoA/oxaloacetate decarboxylase beta subunit
MYHKKEAVINKMRTGKRGIILNISLEIILLFIIIMLNYYFVKDNGINISENATVAIISGADGPTNIYISPKYILRNLLPLLFTLDIIILVIYNFLALKKAKRYNIKNKFKIIFIIDLMIIISVIIEILFNLLGLAISMILNIILISILLIKIYFVKKHKTREIIDE